MSNNPDDIIQQAKEAAAPAPVPASAPAVGAPAAAAGQPASAAPAGNPISLPELTAVFDKWLLMKDREVVKLVMATVIANRLPIDPVWIFLVAPPGGSKTECIRALGKVPDIVPISNITAQTFVSGLPRKDVDLLPKITGKTITFKDFTTILEDRPDVQKEILSQLREIYDGEYNRYFGTGKQVAWKGKIGFIAGVTPIIDKHYSVHKSLGERFLQYRVMQPDRKEVLERVKANLRRQTAMRDEIQDATAAYLAGIRIPEALPEIPADIDAKIMEIADIISRNRSAVIRDEFSRTKEIVFVPGIEMSTRIYAQLRTLAIALMILNGDNNFTKEDYRIIYKLGFDSLHYLKRYVLDVLRSYKGWVRTSTIAIETTYSTKTIGYYLEELAVLGACERLKPRENLNVWKIRKDLRDSWFAVDSEQSILNKEGWRVDEEADSAVAGMVSDIEPSAADQEEGFSPSREEGEMF